MYRLHSIIQNVSSERGKYILHNQKYYTLEQMATRKISLAFRAHLVESLTMIATWYLEDLCGTQTIPQ